MYIGNFLRCAWKQPKNATANDQSYAAILGCPYDLVTSSRVSLRLGSVEREQPAVIPKRWTDKSAGHGTARKAFTDDIECLKHAGTERKEHVCQ